MNLASFKLGVYIPLTHADMIRQVMGDAGAGIIGNYTHCSFSSRGTGRFRANTNSNPFIGAAGEASEVEEERIEITVADTALTAVLAAMKAAHPYEEPVFDIHRLEALA